MKTRSWLRTKLSQASTKRSGCLLLSKQTKHKQKQKHKVSTPKVPSQRRSTHLEPNFHNVPKSWPLARLTIPLSAASKHLERLLEGHCMEVCVTNSNPDLQLHFVRKFAKDLVVLFALHLAETISPLFFFFFNRWLQRISRILAVLGYEGIKQATPVVLRPKRKSSAHSL